MTNKTMKIMAMLTCAIVISSLNADNLIKNGDLEDKTGWGLPAEGSWVQEDGNQFFRLEQQEPGKMLMVYKEYTIPEGTKALKFSVDGRTKDIVKGEKVWFGPRVLLKLTDSSNKQVGKAPVIVFGDNADWQTKSVEIAVPDGVTKFVMMPTLFRVKSGSMDLDNFVLEAIVPEAKVEESEKIFATSESVVIPASSEIIQYVGRFSDDFCFGWSGATIRLKFQGTDLLARIKLTGGSKGGLQVVTDGLPNDSKMYVTKGQEVYTIASGLTQGEHTVELVKTDEGYISEMCIEGFSLPKGGKFLPVEKKERQIMVIGDSITCGYANETLNRNEGNKVENQNAYLTYGQFAGRALNADVIMLCRSGYGIYRSRNLNNDLEQVLPNLFDLTLPRNSKVKFDLSQEDPDIIAINLGTNDQANGAKKGVLQKDDYIGAYKKFIDRLEKTYPGAKIIVSIGPMYRGAEMISWLKEIADSDPKVYFLLYGNMGEGDIGGHWHPSVQMHKKMGKALSDKIVEITGWEE